MTSPKQHQSRLTATGTPTPSGFEVLAITAGEGNGWLFSPDCLKQSLPLWNNAQCFIDHSLYSRSVRDLAGTYSNPRWNDDQQGIILTLTPAGPSADLLTEIGKEILSTNSPLSSRSTPEGSQGEGPGVRIGFSADVSFTAINNQVQEILKVHSVDLVLDPARGGQFIRLLNSKLSKGLPIMTNHSPDPTPTQTPTTPDIEAERQAMLSLLDAHRQQQALADEAEKARQTHAAMCSYLLESGLAASRLPAPMQEQVRKQFSGKVFTAAELQTAIEDARQLVSDLTGALTVQGPGRINAMFSEADRLQAAVDDLFNIPRSPEHATLSTPRLSGIRELYLTLTGDYDLHGGYYPDRVQLATTADFTGLIKNALNKIVVNTWDMLGRAGYDWFRAIATVEHFNTLQSITGTLIGTVGSLPEVAEGAEYTELEIGDSPETATFKKYGGYIPLTLELIDRDETRKLQAYARELASAGLRKISSLVAEIFTANSGIGPTMADGGALFNATAVTTAGGHANLRTTALSADEWEAVCTAVYNQPMLIKNASGYYGTGPKMAINPRYLLVPRQLQLTAMKILYPSLENKTSIYSENLQRGKPGDVITVPEWTDATDWAAVCDPAIAPAIYIGERFGLMPEVFIAGSELSPAVFTNDEHRLKVRHFLAVWVNDFRPLHKSNVA